MSVDTSKHVAVIGAGAAGLVTARELMAAGHSVRVFEQLDDVGGIWIYDPATADDPLSGGDVHTSLYASLRTNLPRDLMAFLDYTFDSTGGGEDAWARFPSHLQVREYLSRYADAFDLRRHIDFGTRVSAVTAGERWRVELEGTDAAGEFDAVAVCNGHYFDPRVPPIAGMQNFPGKLMHSHNYRTPDPFHGEHVVVLGVSASGVDLHREIASVANHVYFCGDAFNGLAPDRRVVGNVSYCPDVGSLDREGRVRFVDGSASDPIDSFVFCTGYHFSFPFADDLVTVDDNWIKPIHQHLLHIDHPTLAFIGLPLRIIPFPLFQMQARWLAKLLRADFELPTGRQMHAAETARHEAHLASGGKQHNTHLLGQDQTAYFNLLAGQCGEPPLPDWREAVASAHYENARRHPGSYHDQPLPSLGPTTVPPESIAAD